MCQSRCITYRRPPAWLHIHWVRDFCLRLFKIFFFSNFKNEELKIKLRLTPRKCLHASFTKFSHSKYSTEYCLLNILILPRSICERLKSKASFFALQTIFFHLFRTSSTVRIVWGFLSFKALQISCQIWYFSLFNIALLLSLEDKTALWCLYWSIRNKFSPSVKFGFRFVEFLSIFLMNVVSDQISIESNTKKSLQKA